MNARVRIQTLELKNNFAPYLGVLFFITILVFAHTFWKLVVNADLHGHQISILGQNLTNQFYALSTLTAEWVYQLVKLLPNSEDFYRHGTFLYFEGGSNCISVIWGCTAVKQLYIFVILIALYRGPVKSKLWYIPTGALVLGIYNVIRIAMICVLTKNNPERFESLHDGWFRYIFYGLIFILWVIWEEKFVKNQQVEAE